MPLPGAEKGIPGVPQRSKNARKSESPMHFSGTARWGKREITAQPIHARSANHPLCRALVLSGRQLFIILS